MRMLKHTAWAPIQLGELSLNKNILLSEVKGALIRSLDQPNDIFSQVGNDRIELPDGRYFGKQGRLLPLLDPKPRHATKIHNACK